MNNANDKSNEEKWEEITLHLMKDEKPSDYLKEISSDKEFEQYPFSMLWKLKDTEQSKKYHPEGSVWNHTMLVLDEAAKVRGQSKDSKAFMWAALLHDIGKPGTTRNRKGKITSYDHDKAGEKLSNEFLRVFTDDEELIRNVSAMVRYHMHMLYVLKDLPYGDVAGMLSKVDMEDIALLCRCDRFGRTGADRKAEDAEYDEFLKIIKRMAAAKNVATNK
jgi:putative nucleotidyltransferase with HDIG domain